MKPEPLIKKLFAIERAIDQASAATLRALVIEAQEIALQLDLENLHDIEAIRRHMEQRRVGQLEHDAADSDDTELCGCA